MKGKRQTVRMGWALERRVGHCAGVTLITLVCFIPQAFSLLLTSWCWYNTHCYVDPRSSSKPPFLPRAQLCPNMLSGMQPHLHLSLKQGKAKADVICSSVVKLRSRRMWGPCIRCKAVLERDILPRKRNFGPWKVAKWCTWILFASALLSCRLWRSRL